VTVGKERKENQYGTWERGFKFSTRYYGTLSKTIREKIPYKCQKNKWQPLYGKKIRAIVVHSVDHGATWHKSISDAMKVRKGRVVLSKNMQGELAFEAIQAISRKYDGPGYKWRP